MLQKILIENHENQFAIVEEKQDEESGGIQMIFAIDPSLFKVMRDITEADKEFYQGVIIEIQDA